MDRGPDRRPPVPPEDRYGSSRGQSYRPRSPPPARGPYRPRSPPRDYRPSDYRGPPRPRSRSPPPFRRRSRSPPPYRRDGYGPRPHSPPRRFDREREMGYRGPPPMRDEPRFRDRSPMSRGERSPLPAKRSRDASPLSARGRFSPPPAKRERLVSPARSRYSDMSGRDRSPPRRGFSPRGGRTPPGRRDYGSPMRLGERVDPRAVEHWRRRSPSPRRMDPRSGNGTDSAPGSGPTSRKPSPPAVHPSRLAAVGIRDEVMTSRPPTRPVSPRPRSPPRRPASPPRERDAPPVRQMEARAPPTGPAARPDQTPRAPPSGPGMKPAASVPPSAPRGGPLSTPAPARTEAPSGPRAGRPSPYSPTIPSGPRSANPAAYRTTTTPSAPAQFRTQRFPSQSQQPRVHPALASLPLILDEGKKFPDLFDRSTLEKLERQTEEMRRVAEEKQAKKRRGLREWDRLEREVQLADLRLQLAEESLAKLEGGDVVASF